MVYFTAQECEENEEGRGRTDFCEVLQGAFFTLRKLNVRLNMKIAMLILGKTYAFTW